MSEETETLLAELDALMEAWRDDAYELVRDGMRSDADAIRQCRGRAYADRAISEEEEVVTELEQLEQCMKDAELAVLELTRAAAIVLDEFALAIGGAFAAARERVGQ